MAPCCRAADVDVKGPEEDGDETSGSESDSSEATSAATSRTGSAASKTASRASRKQRSPRKSSDVRDMISTGLKSFTSTLRKSFTAGNGNAARSVAAGEAAAAERAKHPHWQQGPSAKEMRAMQQAQLEAKRLKEEQQQVERTHHNTLDGRSLANSRQTSMNNHTVTFSRQASHSTHAGPTSHAPSASTSRRASAVVSTDPCSTGGTRAFSRQPSHSMQPTGTALPSSASVRAVSAVGSASSQQLPVLPALTPALVPAGFAGNKLMPLDSTMLKSQLLPLSSAMASRPGSGVSEHLHMGQGLGSLGLGTGMGLGVGMGMGAGVGTLSRTMSEAERRISQQASGVSRPGSGAAFRGLTQYDPNTDYLAMLTSSANSSQAASTGMLSKSVSMNDQISTGRGLLGSYGASMNKSLKQRYADMPHLPGVMEEGASDLGSGRLGSGSGPRLL